DKNRPLAVPNCGKDNRDIKKMGKCNRYSQIPVQHYLEKDGNHNKEQDDGHPVISEAFHSDIRKGHIRKIVV
ncbi:MAG TPA: hypothetical protein PK477_04920, partial [Methanoregulaceae archaeon]|nr:hypothetical protein [Methanoregulaceae archaeon]